MTGDYYIELLLSVGIIGLNQIMIRFIESAAMKKEASDSVSFILKWHMVRVGILLAAVTGIILVNKIDTILFTGVFIIFYLGTKLYNLFRYGTTIR
ncbi:MAG: hypothetical protein AB7S78_00145 [Candidatus Omnitrophota bacterium]